MTIKTGGCKQNTEDKFLLTSNNCYYLKYLKMCATIKGVLLSFQ